MPDPWWGLRCCCVEVGPSECCGYFSLCQNGWARCCYNLWFVEPGQVPGSLGSVLLGDVTQQGKGGDFYNRPTYYYMHNAQWPPPYGIAGWQFQFVDNGDSTFSPTITLDDGSAYAVTLTKGAADCCAANWETVRTASGTNISLPADKVLYIQPATNACPDLYYADLEFRDLDPNPGFNGQLKNDDGIKRTLTGHHLIADAVAYFNSHFCNNDGGNLESHYWLDRVLIQTFPTTGPDPDRFYEEITIELYHLAGSEAFPSYRFKTVFDWPKLDAQELPYYLGAALTGGIEVPIDSAYLAIQSAPDQDADCQTDPDFLQCNQAKVFLQTRLAGFDQNEVTPKGIPCVDGPSSSVYPAFAWMGDTTWPKLTYYYQKPFRVTLTLDIIGAGSSCPTSGDYVLDWSETEFAYLLDWWAPGVGPAGLEFKAIGPTFVNDGGNIRGPAFFFLRRTTADPDPVIAYMYTLPTSLLYQSVTVPTWYGRTYDLNNKTDIDLPYSSYSLCDDFTNNPAVLNT